MYLSRVCYMELFYGPLRVELRTGEDVNCFLKYFCNLRILVCRDLELSIGLFNLFRATS